MTTITYRDGVVAADTRMVAGGWIGAGSARKIFRMQNGGVCAVTGDLAIGTTFIDWFDGDKANPRPSLGDDCRVISFRNNKITVHEGGGSFEMEGSAFYAWGSGAPAALAAMHLGADAMKAVEVASIVDPYTGGPFVFMRVGD